ncbi:Dihydrofolate reductase [Bacillus paralicheniformis]|uniref:Dihydrofolate reductase n=1 Tax=Bacillus paralicheniformis TaxID=1648923 RepID=A0AAW6KC73_9BACI|nr:MULTISPECIES: dihydrofolate reductase [Bacillus]MDE1383389.1 dihydrofolate reductase [Bacillus paralicheniformis]MDE1452331.1 dihydrofolate reductase [Bacillus paralicheniformis]PRS11248.1 dihydrofolate reductase [Bacillus paralicheniformis]TAI53526.1 dihydrofolate reductase [Bacillus paralicheniformis]TWK50670.1 Dihydrofolate reductase [Bacillus paralicheniformis]
MISLITAMDRNRLIGKDNDLPWHLPQDLKYFKEVTKGHAVIMGRKTFESIGRPLPHRENIIVTSNKELDIPNCQVMHSTEEAVRFAKNKNEECFVIGGSTLYAEILPFADKLYVTKIDETFEGDRYFPEFSEAEWEIVSRRKGLKDDKNPYDYEFLVYQRKG